MIENQREYNELREIARAKNWDVITSKDPDGPYTRILDARGAVKWNVTEVCAKGGWYLEWVMRDEKHILVRDRQAVQRVVRAPFMLVDRRSGCVIGISHG